MIESLDQNKCNGCGICIEICPMDVFRLSTRVDVTTSTPRGYPVRRSSAQIAFTEDCMTCFTCELKCPAGAIFVALAPPDPPAVIPGIRR